MANTNIGFTINIDGIDNIGQLNAAIKQTKKDLEGLTVGTEEYANTSKKLAQLQSEQKALRKSQTELTKSFTEQTNALGAYDKASAKLNRLRKEFKNLAIEGRAASKEGRQLQEQIGRLDKQLKETDATVGQFQRNVGNYPRIFGQSTKEIFKTIPALDKLNQRLEKTTGVSNILGKALIGGFIAFRAAKVVADVFKQLNELIKKIDEVRNAVAALSGVGGEELDSLTANVSALATTFDADANEIAKSAKALSESLGISFEEALGQIENGLKAGQESNEEFLSSIQETPEAFKDIAEATGDYAERTDQLLQANKELAAAQIELSNEFSSSASGLKTIGVQVQTFLLKALLALIDIFKPVVRAFQDLGKSLSSLFKIFGSGGKELGVFEFILNRLKEPLEFFSALLQILVNAITEVVNGVRDLVERFPILQTIFKKVQGAVATFTQTFKDLPFIFSGITDALKQLGTNLSNFFKQRFIDAQILAARIKGVFGGAVKEQIEDLKRQQAELKNASKSVSKAFFDGIEEARKEARDRAAAEEKKQREIQAAENLKAAKEAATKEAVEKRKIALEEARKQREQLQKEREKFLADEQKFLESQAALVAKLTERTEKLILDGIQDAQLKARKTAQANSTARIEAAKADFDQLSELATQREVEALRLFGAGSEQLKAAQAQAQAERVAAEEQLNAILTRERINLTNELLAIDEQFRSEEEKRRNESARIALDIQKTQLERRFAEGLESEEDYQNKLFELEKKRIQAEINLLSERLAAGDQENQQLILQKESLLTQLAQLEKAYRDEQKQADIDLTEKQKQLQEERIADFQQQFAKFVGFAKQGLDFIGQFQDAQIERQKAGLEQLAEDNQKSNELLQERLSQASGLEAEFLQQKIDQNVQAAQSIAAQQEAIEKQQARQAKRRAILESIIQTALAVVEALPNPIAATLAGVTGAAQTAVIAAQPLATGGKVGKGNIRPLSNGDNVLATLTTGEAVLNAEQQRRIGGAPVLAAAGVPGFATGGVVGAPSSLVAKTVQKESEVGDIIKRLEGAIQATNGRIDRMQVVYTAQTQDDVERGNKDKNDIRVNASF